MVRKGFLSPLLALFVKVVVKDFDTSCEPLFTTDIFSLSRGHKKLKQNKTIAYLEYDIAKDKVNPEDADKVSEERYKIRPEKEQQAKEELKDMYGKEFDGYLFEDAMEETDKLLEGKVAVREEEIEVNRDMNERRR